MTDRFHSLTVTLSKNVREDDAQALIAAIGQLRGVIDVSGNVANIDSHIAEARARQQLGDAIWQTIYPSKP